MVPFIAHQWRKSALFLLFALGITIFWSAPPATLSIEGWRVFLLFLVAILILSTQLLSLTETAIISIISFSLLDPMGLESHSKSLALILQGFAAPILWLIVVSFFLSSALIKSGLGDRIAWFLVKRFGKTPVSLAYALALADLITAPGIPSNTARSGGIIFPIIQSLAHRLQAQDKPDEASSLGKYLTLSLTHTNDITSLLFLTAYAANPYVIMLASSQAVNITWLQWFIFASLPAFLALFVSPLILYFLFQSDSLRRLNLKAIMDDSPVSTHFSRHEIQMSCILLGLIGLWISAPLSGIDTTTAAFIALGASLLIKTLDVEMILNNQDAWRGLWFGVFVMLATILQTSGFTPWLSHFVLNHSAFLQDLHWYPSLIILTLLYFYLHYFFVSGTAQVVALFPAFLSIAISLDISALVAAFSFGFTSSLYSSITTYSHAKCPVLQGKGYVSTREWLKAGFLIPLVNLFIFLTVGIAWWTYLANR